MHELSDAILKGCAMTPRSCVDVLTEGTRSRRATCALGALWEGTFGSFDREPGFKRAHASRAAYYRAYESLISVYPILEESLASVARKTGAVHPGGEPYADDLTLYDAIAGCNDDQTGGDRERVARDLRERFGL